MKSLTLTAVALFVAGGLFIGCASAPSQELTSAQESINQAKQAQADFYVADLYQAAQDSLAAAQAEIEAENGKFALSRNYDHATQLLQFASETATNATTQVAERKETMRAETQDLIAQAQVALEKAQTLLLKAPSGKEGRMALVSITADTGTARTTLTEAQTALQNDDIPTAHNLAQQALDKANSLVQELETAITKTNT